MLSDDFNKVGGGGDCIPNQKLAWFVLYLKIINIFFFLKNDTCIL